MPRWDIGKINSRNKRIVADFERGNKVSALAKKYGLVGMHICRIIREVRERNIGKRDAAILSDYMAKKSVKEIADKYGMTEQYVKRIIGKAYLAKKQRL
jgi:Mor family transcriptional regulator